MVTCTAYYLQELHSILFAKLAQHNVCRTCTAFCLQGFLATQVMCPIAAVGCVRPWHCAKQTDLSNWFDWVRWIHGQNCVHICNYYFSYDERCMQQHLSQGFSPSCQCSSTAECKWELARYPVLPFTRVFYHALQEMLLPSLLMI